MTYVVTCLADCFANMYAKRLYDDLLSNYNRLIRPVNNNTEKLTVWLNLKLSQLIDVVIAQLFLKRYVFIHPILF